MEKQNLESYAIWRFIKVVWLVSAIFIWICGIFAIFDFFTDTDTKHQVIVNNYGQIVGFERVEVPEYQIASEWRYIQMFLVMLIHTGLVVLATIIAYKLALYIAFGDDKNSKILEKNSEKISEENTEKSSQKIANISENIFEKNENEEETVVEEITETDDKIIITETKTRIIKK